METLHPKLTVPSRPARRVAPRLLGLAGEYWRMMAFGMLGLAGGSAINLLFPYLIGRALNEDFGLKLSEDLPLITAVLIGLFIVQAVLFYIRHYCFHAVGYNVVSGLRTALYGAIMNQDVSFFDTAKVGDLLSRLASDTQIVQRAVTINISVALRYILQVVGGIVLMIMISWKLALVILLAVPLMTAASIYWGRKLKELSRTMQAELGAASVIAEETAVAARTVRVYCGESQERRRYAQAVERARETGVARAAVGGVFSSTMVFVLHSSIALIVWYGAELVLSGELNIGDLTAFLLYGVIVAVSFGFLAAAWDEFTQAVGAGERIFEIIDTKPRIVAVPDSITLPQNAPAALSFEHVSFSYPARPEVSVLKDVSFDLHPGQTLALVGPSGSGKSTIASLIPRFYDPSKGTVRYAELDLRRLDPLELRQRIALVSQEPQVFSVSIAENIRYGRPDASDDEVRQAAAAAQLSALIETLPSGIDTLVGNRGVQLSGGERQRIAIARALLRNAPLLILDEATSALDSENEFLVQRALRNLTQGRTTLVIAHRLSTVQHADRVLVLREGQIVQDGTHAELVTAPGLYRTLVEHQML